jgi:hypothetical protein
MLRNVVVSCLVLAVTATSVFADDNSSGKNDLVRGGGLVCFAITPASDRGSSCDQLCAGKDAVCVGLTTNGAMNPGIGCADISDARNINDYIASCRCCAVAH